LPDEDAAAVFIEALKARLPEIADELDTAYTKWKGHTKEGLAGLMLLVAPILRGRYRRH
jgi:hypothetical protein